MTWWWRTVVCGCAVILGLTTGPAAWALFTDTVSVKSGNISAGAIATPAAPTVTQTVNGASLSFVATTAGPSDGRPDKYEVLSHDMATGGSATIVCNGLAPAPAQCTVPNPTNVNLWFSVRARVGDNWIKVSPRAAYPADSTAPTTTTTAPCSATVVVCGTAADPAGVTRVEYQFQRSRRVLGLLQPTLSCWDGAKWVEVACAAFRNATGTTTWQVPGTPSVAYVAPPALTTQSFTLQVRATDTFGNVSAVQSVTFTA